MTLPTQPATEEPVFLVDDDAAVRDSLALLLGVAGFKVQAYGSAHDFLDAYVPGQGGCLVTDIRMPGMDGLELQAELMRRNIDLPVIFITGHGDVAKAVQALKTGACDFIEKPFEEEVLTSSIRQAFDKEANRLAPRLRREAAGISTRRALLTPREAQVMDLVVDGHSNKSIAQKLGISARTVEIHRARVMDKMKARNLSDLVRMALRASCDNADAAP
ncbi:MAG: response regulator transcription factor [Alphaproteobacteria bacterium]|nr:response regulator transcription factor [Alphaproteobacteria bacterium]